MPRKTCAWLLCFSFIISFAPVSLAADPTFTILVYLCGTDLETYDGSASEDLYEMMDAGISADGPITVLVETGGTQEWWIDEIDSRQNERWVLDDDGMYCVEEMRRKNMGDPDTLQSFIEYGVSEYPADRYGLILWDHGGGSVGGVCFDEYTDEYLTTVDVYSALSGASKAVGGLRFDFVAFDACLMATFEMANHLKDFTDYMVASEEVLSSTGFDYTSWLRALGRNPGMTTRALCETIVDTTLKTNLAYDPDDYLTLSVLDLREMGALTQALEAIGTGLRVALDSGELRTISRFRQNMRSFGDYVTGADSSDMVDLRQFIQTYASLSGVDASDCLRALDQVVVYNRYTENNLENIGGISILVPLKTANAYQDYIAYYDALTLYPGYTTFITEYMALMLGGDYVFSASAPQRIDFASIVGAMAGASQESAADDAPAEAPTMSDALGDSGVLSYSLTLTEEDMRHLSYVEGNLMVDISEEDFECYIDLGYLRDAAIDWENNTVYSMFDGTWPMLEDQLVYMTDQTVTAKSRRSIIDVLVNGEEMYLLVVFDDDRPGGEVIGYTEGYTENGLPVRGYRKLAPGDVIIPLYYLVYWDEDDEQQFEPYEGDPIVYTGEALAFSYYNLVGEDFDFAYSFCLNDIFGGYQFSDFIFFTL